MVRRFEFAKKMAELKPGKTVEIAGIAVDFTPLKFGKLAEALRHLDLMSEELKEAGVTFENYNQYKYLVKLVTISMDKAPEFLQDLSNIHVDDLRELDLPSIVKVMEAVIEVNVSSFENLSKNWKGLTEKVASLPFVSMGEKSSSEDQAKQ